MGTVIVLMEHIGDERSGLCIAYSSDFVNGTFSMRKVQRQVTLADDYRFLCIRRQGFE
ncbi:MAG: hypothetical protein WCR76_01760 [Sphaerochaetaceae bacterium]|jgi:hypothetical protein